MKLSPPLFLIVAGVRPDVGELNSRTSDALSFRSHLDRTPGTGLSSAHERNRPQGDPGAGRREAQGRRPGDGNQLLSPVSDRSPDVASGARNGAALPRRAGEVPNVRHSRGLTWAPSSPSTTGPAITARPLPTALPGQIGRAR